MPDTSSSFSVDAIRQNWINDRGDFVKFVMKFQEEHKDLLGWEAGSIQLDDDMIALLDKFERDMSDRDFKEFTIMDGHPQNHYFANVLPLIIEKIILRPNFFSDKDFNTINRMVELINKCDELPKDASKIKYFYAKHVSSSIVIQLRDLWDKDEESINKLKNLPVIYAIV